MSQTVFSGAPTGRYSIGAGDRYCQLTLSKTSGDVIPSGATIYAVTLNMSDVDVHSTGYGGTERGIKINDVRLADFAMTPHADHVNFTLNNILATPELYVGKSALTFWIGFESGAAQHDWCSFNGACVVSVTVAYEAKSSATLQSSTVEAGTNVRVNITRANAGYTHKVTYALGTYSEVHTGVATVDNYTIPLGWCNAMPNTTSGSGAVTVETFNGAQSLGSVTLALTVTVPASAVPTAGTLNLGAVGLLDGQYYVQGRTTITPTVSGQSGIYGSTIVGLQFTHSGLLTQSGSVTITATVTDSRGRTAQTTKTITVYAYNDPVQAVEMFRCDEDGNRDDSGDKVWVKSTVTGTPIPSVGSNVNILTIIAEYREVGAGSWTGTRFLTSGTGVVMDGPFDTTKSYEVRVIVSELAGGGSIKVETIQTSGFLLFIKKDGTGVAFGKACEHANALEIPGGWDYYRGSDRVVPLIDNGAVATDLNNAIAPGFYTWSPSTAHIPYADTYGVCISYTSDGKPYNGIDNWLYQEAHTTGNVVVYLRQKINDSDFSSWVRFDGANRVTNNLTSTYTDRALSAYQGNVLKGLIDALVKIHMLNGIHAASEYPSTYEEGISIYSCQGSSDTGGWPSIYGIVVTFRPHDNWGNRIVQLNINNDGIYVRRSSGASSWSTWYKYTGTAV